MQKKTQKKKKRNLNLNSFTSCVDSMKFLIQVLMFPTSRHPSHRSHWNFRRNLSIQKRPVNIFYFKIFFIQIFPNN